MIQTLGSVPIRLLVLVVVGGLLGVYRARGGAAIIFGIAYIITSVIMAIIIVIGVVLFAGFNPDFWLLVGAIGTAALPGLFVGGVVRIIFGALTLRGGSNAVALNRSARSPVSTYVALPTEAPEGVCWQCGRRVRGEAIICPSCGATQTTQRRAAPAAVAVEQDAGMGMAGMGMAGMGPNTGYGPSVAAGQPGYGPQGYGPPGFQQPYPQQPYPQQGQYGQYGPPAPLAPAPGGRRQRRSGRQQPRQSR